MKNLLIAMAALMLISTSVAFAEYESTTADVNVNADAKAETFSGSVAIAKSDGVNGSYNSKGSDLGDMVGAAIAPALTTTLTETCMGSTSIGAGWSGGGVSFGTTWRDSACVRRLDAREIKSIHPNFAIAAKEMMCDSDKVYEAFKRAGMPCVFQEDKEPRRAKVETASASIPVKKSGNTEVAGMMNGFF